MQVGTQVIDHLVEIMTEKELKQVGVTRKQVHLSTVILKRNTAKGLDVPTYDLGGVNGKIYAIWRVVIPPFGTTVAKGIINLMTHSNCLNVFVEPVLGYSEHITMTRCYGVLKPGRGNIDICLGIIV